MLQLANFDSGLFIETLIFVCQDRRKTAAARFTTHYYTLHVFNVLSTFKHYFTQNMTLSSVNTYNFHSNVKEIKKISVNQLFRQRVTASMIFIHRDNPKLLSDHVLTLFRRCDFLPKYTQIQLQIILFLLKANYIIFLNSWS